MVIRNPKLPEGVVTPKIDLLTKLPEQALHLDQRKVAESAPRSFQSLLRILGVEASIENLITAVCME
ncbi:hypothetical protein MATL_G00077100 [Megalops atlanticus]|uniref:Centromere protein P n=1 Tax=Megalops atlanticus TaxID=7932 RepID=A0A9D3Q8W7_MEGAT|nr:hypothetical protein MATL_G00077100 [Megalops atlanticus]